jgi:protein-disulfide isomerase
LRNLLTAIAAIAIIGAAGVAYFANHKSAPDKPGSTPVASGSVETMVGSSAAAAASGPESPTAATQTAQIDQPQIGPDEHVLGKADAPLTIIEYASMTCPHCAHFDTETMPRIKSEYIDKGLVRFVFRPFPLDALAARASLMAQCAPADGYFPMIDILFRSQTEWARATDPAAALKQIGRTAGLSDADIDRCTADQAALDRIIAGIKEAQTKFGVDSTPSFVINGKKYTNMPFDDYQDDGTTKPGFGKVIKDLLPKS